MTVSIDEVALDLLIALRAGDEAGVFGADLDRARAAAAMARGVGVLPAILGLSADPDAVVALDAVVEHRAVREDVMKAGRFPSALDLVVLQVVRACWPDRELVEVHQRRHGVVDVYARAGHGWVPAVGRIRQRLGATKLLVLRRSERLPLADAAMRDTDALLRVRRQSVRCRWRAVRDLFDRRRWRLALDAYRDGMWSLADTDSAIFESAEAAEAVITAGYPLARTARPDGVRYVLEGDQ